MMPGVFFGRIRKFEIQAGITRLFILNSARVLVYCIAEAVRENDKAAIEKLNGAIESLL